MGYRLFQHFEQNASLKIGSSCCLLLVRASYIQKSKGEIVCFEKSHSGGPVQNSATLRLLIHPLYYYYKRFQEEIVAIHKCNCNCACRKIECPSEGYILLQILGT